MSVGYLEINLRWVQRLSAKYYHKIITGLNPRLHQMPNSFKLFLFFKNMYVYISIIKIARRNSTGEKEIINDISSAIKNK